MPTRNSSNSSPTARRGFGALLRLYRFALAPAAHPVAGGTARALVVEWLKLRDGVILDWTDDGEWPAGIAELTAGLALCAAETGRGTLSVTAGNVALSGTTTLAEGVAAVLGGAPATTTRHAIAALLAAQAAALGLRIGVETAPLRLTAYQGKVFP